EQRVYTSANIDLDNASKLIDAAKGTSLDISFTLQANAGTEAGINVFKSGDEETTISYNADKKMISLDRTRSGDTSFHKDFASIETMALNNAPGEKIEFRILIDKSMVELFVNDGEYALTDLVFPTKNNGGVELFSKNGKAVFSDIRIQKVDKTIH
ncbi:MAG: GH32 C-terminal domain-containing protein, partial [Panacibacter sp.]